MTPSEKTTVNRDWGEASSDYDNIANNIKGKDLSVANEAQTRFDVIDRMIREVFSWRFGQINVEEPISGTRKGYIDYILRSGDYCVIIEAKKAGAAFPTPTQRKQLKLSGSVLGKGPIAKAIKQVQDYARDKNTDVLVVTNGLCWCIFAKQEAYDDCYASLYFPFDHVQDAENLFNCLSVVQVERGSLRTITNVLPIQEDRLLAVVTDADARVDRNDLADYILPALNNALYADALLQNPEALKRCFVTTEARTKFDSHLGMHLADVKTPLVHPARRMKTGKKYGELHAVVETAMPGLAPPVTLIIGPVGAGKTTYLRHFEQVSGASVITEKKAHWIYVDFEKMGPLGNPRKFIYNALLDYVGADHPGHSMDFQGLVAPAYAPDIRRLSKGPLAPIRNNRELFEQKISEHIHKDYEAVEPYVDKLIKHMAEQGLCVVILDNIDLHEDDKLETTVFAEGLALSKRVGCNVIVSIRDRTFVRHKTDPTFDAFELRKLWLDPPPFKPVLSARLSYSRAILKGKHVKVPFSESIQLDVPDLGVFFDIVQRSILQGHTGDHIAFFADTNIRKGLELVTNFLTSGHIQANRAIASYLKGTTSYYFPNHEIFKGTMLGQWKHYKEGRAECINLFDSRINGKCLRLLRLVIVNFLYERAKVLETLETPVSDCVNELSRVGASESQIVACLVFLNKNRIVRSITAEDITEKSTVVLSPCGGYYSQFLCCSFPYVEACLMDTAIDDRDTWAELADITQIIDSCPSIADRMVHRVHRAQIFMNYLLLLEEVMLDQFPIESPLRVIKKISGRVLQEAKRAELKTQKFYSE
jgi:predicted type IV restriction endonuclease